MQSPTTTRKRADPGASPMPQQLPAQQATFQYPQMQDLPAYATDQFLDSIEGYLHGSHTPYIDPPHFDDNLSLGVNRQQSQPYVPSNQLVRRDTSQQLATRRNQQGNGWSSMDGMDVRPPDVGWDGTNNEEDETLEKKAATAKKDKQAKNKPIPPFVQKLSSFLDSSNRTDLIRWTDDGNSFVVLDEDEFARTMIPELFKHNNYASFVRQLNMYGFHKKVGLGTNSMAAAERKVKEPSEYYHQYFKRGRPDLLWCIQKPQNASKSSKRKRDGGKGTNQNDSDDDGRRDSPDAPNYKPQLTDGSAGQGSDLATMPRSQLSSVRSELRTLQHHQKYISALIKQLKDQNDHFVRQATEFQSLHDRHENSINAILTFLATIYNRNLENNGQSFPNMFSNSIPQNNQQHGSVVDVGDLPDCSTDAPKTQIQRYQKRPLALLPASTNNDPNLQVGYATTASTSRRSSVSPPQTGDEPVPTSEDASHARATSTSSPATYKNDAETPNLVSQVPENDEILSLINSVNATAASTPTTQNPQFDFTAALNDFQHTNGSTPLTPQQRDNLLSLIAQSQDQNSSVNAANNALVSPKRPIMPDLEQMRITQHQLDMLQKLQQDQGNKVQDLQRRLTPLSPTGSIPNLTDNGDWTGDPVDFSAYLNSDDHSYFANVGMEDAGLGSFLDGDQNDDPNAVGSDGRTQRPSLEEMGLNWDFNHPPDDPVVRGGNEDLGKRLTTGWNTANDGDEKVEHVISEATSPANVGAIELSMEGSGKKRRKVG
ncbi:Heat shock transcription factor [Elasticomyces elasticus]|nr:Heat shock transcription factor [Elasticomyces elasticus]